MALEARMVDVPFDGGIDTKTDEKLVLPGKLTGLENGVFTKRRKVRMRNGYTALGTAITGGTSISSGDALGVFRDELLLFSKKDLFSYSSGLNAWVDKGDIVPLAIRKKQVIRNDHEQTLADADTNSGVTLTVWADSRGGIRCTSIDDVSGAPLLSDTQVASNGVTPRCLAVGQKLFIVYKADDSGTHKLKFRAYNPMVPLTLEAETEMVTDVDATNSHFDIALHGTKMVFVYNFSGGGIKIGYLTENGAIGTTLLGLPGITLIVAPARGFATTDVNVGTDEITETAHPFTDDMVGQFTTTGTLPAGLSLATDYFVKVVDANTYQVSATLGGGAVDITDVGTGTHTFTPAADPATNCISVVVESSTQDIYVSWHGPKNGVRCAVLRDDFSLLLNPSRVEAAPAATPINLCGAIPSAGGSIVLFYELTAANSYDHLIRKATLTNAGALTVSAVFKRSVGLASKAFLQDGTIYVSAVHDSTLQATYFVVSESACIAGRESPQVAGGLVATPSLPQVYSDAAGVRRWASLIKTRLVSESNTVFFLRGVAETTLDFVVVERYLSARLGENLHIAGGFLSAYDGQSAVEHGFHLFPENITLVQAATGGFMSDGSYQYSVVFEWTDAQGQIHRSAPSVAATIVVNGTGTVQKVTLTIPTLRLTAKTTPRHDVVLAIYRTIDAGTVFHKITSISSPSFNDPTVDTVAFVDTLADATILANEFLYTTGGVLGNIAPPAASLIAVGKNRIVLAGLEDPNLLWFSKPHVSGEGLGFSDLFIKRINPAGGDISALAIMDDRVIVFKKGRIYGFSGDGPNEAGGGAGFGPVDDINADAGCDSANSVAVTPAGLIFKSKKGFYLLDRSLQVRYIGADVEAFNGLAVTSGVLVEKANQVRFTTSDGVTLVYDYQFDQWSTFTNHLAKDAAVWLTDYVFLRADGEVRRESEGAFKDKNSAITLKLTTAWIKVAGIQGFQRVRRALILGEFKSGHILSVGVGYDYQPGFPENYSFNTTNIIDAVEYGDSAFYGADAVYGGVEDGVYQFERHLQRQKCQSIRFDISHVFAGEPGEAFEISSLGLLIGVKKGAFKPRLEKRA